MTRLEREDIQDILVGYPDFPYARYLFVRLGPPRQARDWLARMAHEVTTADRWDDGRDDSRPWAVNVGLTWQGLAALGATEETLYSFPEEFRVGMARRAKQLGDIGADHPDCWERDGPGTTKIHAVAIVHADTEEHLDDQCRWVRDGLANHGEVVGLAQDGHRLKDDRPSPVSRNPDKPPAREHFGFIDGLSQPIIEGLKRKAPPAELLPGQGVRQGDGTWRPLRAGEIVFGYLDEEDVQPACPTPPELARNGSYLVYRKLGQDVAAFRRLTAEHEALAAKMMGRKPDGTPLARSRSDHAGAFTYADDPDGLSCPIGAHIRRANPRDGFTSQDKLVHRHRMLRRGIPYGPPLPEGARDDGQRGLLFVCLCASIARQFEFVQGQWLADGNSLGLGNDQDPMLSNGEKGNNYTIPGDDRPWFVSRIPRLVTVRGGEYFFLPGRRALGHLATLSTL